MKRMRLAAPVVAIYWLLLVTGLLLYTALRIDEVQAILPLWIGAVGGTALGQVLALRDYRLWVTVALVVAVLTWCVPILPPELSSTELWMAFVPAALCGFWSLGERASLAAFWFPTVIWMLSILDRTTGQATPDGAGVVLLGALAVLFIVFLRVREARRVALWRTIAAAPLAATKPTVVLKEPPGRQLARGGWALLVSTITFGATSWVAPYLWQTESFDAGQAQVDAPELTVGLPCCPVAWDAEVTRSRVTEYFDIGRGHDRIAEPREGIDCQVCEGPATGEIAAIGAIGTTDDVLDGVITGGVGGMTTDETYGPGGRASGHRGGRYAAGQFHERGELTEATGGEDPDGMAGETGMPRGTDPQPPPTAPSLPPETPPVDEPAPADIAPQVAQIDPIAPATPPAVDLAPPAAPVVEPPAPTPVPEPQPPAHIDHLPPTSAPPRASSLQPRRAATAGLGPELLHGIAVLIAAALLFQLSGLALRPLRRWFTLRHLRRPFWDETIDQRVSNSWQLALVGLRDAGWRSTSTEAPREFARRAGVEGLERCATILERARHGIALDAGDLSEMTSAADAAYRSARGHIGPIARAVTWIRWPLT